MKKSLNFQSNLFIMMTLVALALCYKINLNENIYILFITLGLIVLLGVPHGSLDVLFARKTYDLKYLTSWLKFILNYLISSLVIILIWFVAPNFFLISFLILSAIHFSDDLNLADFKIFKLSYGVAIITFPSLFFSTELIKFYAILVDIETANHLVRASQIISLLAAPILAFQILINKIEIRVKLEVLCVFILFLLLNPILAFGIYFCFMHSARHLIRSHYFLSTLTRHEFFNALIFPTLAVIVMGIFVWWSIGKVTIEFDLIRIIFIGLAALTVPHTWVLKKANFQAWSINESSKTY